MKDASVSYYLTVSEVKKIKIKQNKMQKSKCTGDTFTKEISAILVVQSDK